MFFRSKIKNWQFKSLIFTAIFAIFLTSSCAKNEKSAESFKALNIGRSKLDVSAVTETEKEYRKLNGNLRSTIIELASDQVIKSLTNGSIDLFIGTIDIPRNMKEQIKKVPIAKDGIVVVTHPSNPVNNLSKKQVMNIFSGMIDNWSRVGGDKQPIMVINRYENSAEKMIFDKQVFNSSPPRLSNFVKVDSGEEVKDTIAKFPNAISYMSSSLIENKEGLKTLNFNNIPPTRSNISQGYFPLARWILVYFNPIKLKETKKYNSVKEFINLIHSAKGQSLVVKAGLNPLTAGELEIARLDKEPIYIGVSAPRQGAYTDLGRSIINGAKLAAKEVENIGGIDGKPIELIVCDDKGSTAGAVQCAKKFVLDNVLGVIGHLNSQASIEASKIYVKNNIVQITPASTHPWFTERPDSRGYAFRTCGRDDQQAKLLASAIRDLEVSHPLKVSIFNNGTIYGSTLSALIEDEISRYATDQVIEIKAVQQGQQQYHNEIKDLESQVLVFVGEYGDAATLVKALTLDNKSNVIFFGSDGTYSEQFTEEAGLTAEGSYLIGTAINDKSLSLQSFVEIYKERFKTDVSSFAINAYDATKLLLQAIEKAKVKHSSIVAKEVAEVNYHGLTGLINFDEIGDPILPRLAVYKVESGEFVRK